MTTQNGSDPFQVLGVPRDADEEQIRSRYLKLVKQFPPEREPEKFRAIRAAYEATKDPLTLAYRLLMPPEYGEWSDLLKAQRENPPALSARLLLSLGNRGDSNQQDPDPPS